MSSNKSGNRCNREEPCCYIVRERGVRREKKRKEHVPAVTNECVVKLDYHYRTH